MDYSIRIRRDVPGTGYFWVILFLLLIPPAMASYHKFGFERQRWAQSDYAPVGSSSDDGDDD